MPVEEMQIVFGVAPHPGLPWQRSNANLFISGRYHTKKYNEWQKPYPKLYGNLSVAIQKLF